MPKENIIAPACAGTSTTAIPNRSGGKDVVNVLLATTYQVVLGSGVYSQSVKGSLADIRFGKTDSGALSYIRSTYTQPNCTVDLTNFDPKVDIIRVANGDFTLQEILEHGHDAPFYKQARINEEVRQQMAKKGAAK